jgi:protein-tyrosine phosphatase
MRHLAEQRGLLDTLEIDSAGTAAYHAGEPPDRRSIKHARARGIAVGGRARQFVPRDFGRFDYVLALDANNHADLRAMRPDGSRCQLQLLLDYDPESPAGSSVPDPYYGGGAGFDHVLDLCERACNGLLDHIVTQARQG